MHEEDLKKIVPLSVKELAKYERTSFPGNGNLSSGPVVSTETKVTNLKLVDCPESHIGPKIVASHVTVHLPKEKKLSIKSIKCLLICSIVAAILLIIALTLVFTTLPGASSFDDDIIHDGGENPSDWYYTREDRNASECEEPTPRIVRDHLVIDSLGRTCVDPTDCLQLIQSLGEDTDFYLTGGRVYEGFGWNCNPRKGIRLTFLSMGKATQHDMFSFNRIAKLGVEMKEIDSAYEVFPACCVESDSHGPSRSILLFLETLPTFRRRDCLAQNVNCQQNK